MLSNSGNGICPEFHQKPRKSREMDFASCLFGIRPLCSRPVIPRETIDAILERIDLPDLIRERLRLSCAGGTHKGLCPFHDEKTPSFTVYQDHFHCFGCGAHGTAIDFVMRTQGLAFIDAVNALAFRTGITIPRPESHDDSTWPIRKTLKDACAAYQKLLLSEAGWPAMETLLARGIDTDTVMRFGIGFAPTTLGTLSGRAYKTTRRIRWENLLAAGLAIKSKSGKGCRDFFQNRIIFPIMDGQGNILGFGGRRIGENGPKYLNTGETTLFRKGEHLFGLYQAKNAVRKTDAIILCEGYFDVLTLSQAGIENIVSTCGTALTEQQARFALSLACHVQFCFDGDAAGNKATFRAARLVARHVTDAHEVRLCRLPSDHDPDSFARTEGADAFRSLLETAPTLSTYLVGEITRGARVPEKRARSFLVARELLDTMKSSPVLARFFRQSLGEALSLSDKDLDDLLAIRTDTAWNPADANGNLAACPCCGEPGILFARKTGQETIFKVCCPSCRLSTPALPSDDEACAAWNRRPG
jgi:DNA primase